MRLVFPTPSSPTRQILNLNVFDSESMVGFRIMLGAKPARGVIKPSARFSVSGTDGLEPLDVRDCADSGRPRLELRADREAGSRPIRRDQEPMHESAPNPPEGDEPPDLGPGQRASRAIYVGHRDGLDPTFSRNLDEFRELGETVLAEEAGRHVVEMAGGAARGEQPPLVPEGHEESLARHPGGIDVVCLHVTLPHPMLPGVRRAFEERHRSSSRKGRKYRMSRTLPRRSPGGFQTALTRIPIRISSFVISPK